MKFVDEFRDREKISHVTQLIADIAPRSPVKIMEVCGGHTHSIHKYGLKSMLPPQIKLINGPGCPVCVTPVRFIDELVSLMQNNPDTILVTFGELLRIPGSSASLQKLKASGHDIRICYSAMEAVKHASANPERNVVLAGIGFETTAPTVAAVVPEAEKNGLSNFFLMSALKTMPEAMRAVLESGEVKLDGMICPGHVSVVTGAQIFDFIPMEFQIPCSVSGFEPLDILQSVYQILQQIRLQKPEVQIQYSRAVTVKGNAKAKEMLDRVFLECEADWRGFGPLKDSGLRLKDKYSSFDAYQKFEITPGPSRENKACICADIIRGAKEPAACRLFGKVCSPDSPSGPCMVSDEGACSIYYQYSGVESWKK